MKKCKDCHREIDKYMIACDYCGKLQEHEENSQENNNDTVEKKAKEE